MKVGDLQRSIMLMLCREASVRTLFLPALEFKLLREGELNELRLRILADRRRWKLMTPLKNVEMWFLEVNRI